MLRLEQLEDRDTPAFIVGWDGPETVLYHDLDNDGQSERIIAAGVGGSARVMIEDVESGDTLANFIAFEDEFRGGGQVTVSGDTLAIAPGPGGGGRIVTFTLKDGIVGSHPVPCSPGYRGGVKIAAAPNGVLVVAGSYFSHLNLNGAVHQSVYIGPDWRFEPTGGYVREGQRIEATLERGPVVDAHVAETMRLELRAEVV